MKCVSVGWVLGIKAPTTAHSIYDVPTCHIRYKRFVSVAPTRPRTNEVSFIQLHHPHMRLANCNDITTAEFLIRIFIQCQTGSKFTCQLCPSQQWWTSHIVMTKSIDLLRCMGHLVFSLGQWSTIHNGLPCTTVTAFSRIQDRYNSHVTKHLHHCY